jgi:hypothetical protein
VDRLGETPSAIMPVDRALDFLPEVRVDEQLATRFVNGQVLNVKPPGELARVYGPGGFLGIGQSSWNRYLKPRKLLK